MTWKCLPTQYPLCSSSLHSGNPSQLCMLQIQQLLIRKGKAILHVSCYLKFIAVQVNLRHAESSIIDEVPNVPLTMRNLLFDGVGLRHGMNHGSRTNMICCAPNFRFTISCRSYPVQTANDLYRLRVGT